MLNLSEVVNPLQDRRSLWVQTLQASCVSAVGRNSLQTAGLCLHTASGVAR
jgi:hypothetical protein